MAKMTFGSWLATTKKHENNTPPHSDNWRLLGSGTFPWSKRFFVAGVAYLFIGVNY